MSRRPVSRPAELFLPTMQARRTDGVFGGARPRDRRTGVTLPPPVSRELIAHPPHRSRPFFVPVGALAQAGSAHWPHDTSCGFSEALENVSGRISGFWRTRRVPVGQRGVLLREVGLKISLGIWNRDAHSRTRLNPACAQAAHQESRRNPLHKFGLHLVHLLQLIRSIVTD